MKTIRAYHRKDHHAIEGTVPARDVTKVIDVLRRRGYERFTVVDVHTIVNPEMSNIHLPPLSPN